MTETVVGLLVLGYVVVWAVSAAAEAKARRVSALQRLAELLGGTATTDEASGHRDGVAITHRMTSRGAGSSTESWTEVDCALGAEPLMLELRPHACHDGGYAAGGRTIATPVGDATVDAVFRIEGAPRDIVVRLFDDDVRSYLVAHPRAELTTMEVATADGVHRFLRLAVPGWLEDAEAAAAAWDVGVAMRRNLRAAYEATFPPPATAGSPFRPELDDEPARVLEATRQRDLAAVAAVRARRAAEAADRAPTLGIVAFLIVVLLMAYAFAASSRGHSFADPSDTSDTNDYGYAY